uniref:Uncharacterized protein n=1 Tax=viral metagenome TaxID=1070528 RepID=A0A6C0BS41_9ZZZZ
MSRDSIITNSVGIQGKIIGKTEEFREVKKIPVNEKEAKEYGFTDEQVKDFVKESKKEGGMSIRDQSLNEIIKGVPKQLLHCTRVEGVEPTKQPVVINVDYDLDKGIKHVTTKKEKHYYSDPKEKGESNKYKMTVITEERFPENISQHEKECMEKNNLMDKLQKEVDEVDLDTIKDKEDILKFANGNGGISNTEKKRRAVLLLKRLDPVLKERFEQEKKEYKEKKAIIWTNESGKGKSELLNEIKKMSIPYYERPRITSLEISNL